VRQGYSVLQSPEKHSWKLLAVSTVAVGQETIPLEGTGAPAILPAVFVGPTLMERE
jgi:hypothetical protein